MAIPGEIHFASIKLKSSLLLDEKQNSNFCKVSPSNVHGCFEKWNLNIFMPWHWVLWRPLESFGLSPSCHSADKSDLQFWALWDTKVPLFISTACPCLLGCLFSLFFQRQPKGTKLTCRIYKRIVAEWSMLICREFHKQKNPKAWLLLIWVSPFLCTLSNNASSNAPAFPWVREK